MEEEADEQPSSKSDIHGHVVYCDDANARQYLRQLDSDEAATIFDQAKKHQRADFEVKTSGGSRYDFHMLYDNGAYQVIAEGHDESSSSGWF